LYVILFFIIHYKYAIIFEQFFTMFPILFFYYKACSWNIGFLQVANISKLHHMFKSNHRTFYVQISIQIFSVKNANPSLYAKHVENGYFPLPSKFEMQINIPSRLDEK
jgi:hypothetical protein